MLELMERAGCYLTGLGIESGVDATLSRMGKKQTTEQVRKTVEMIRKHTSIQVTGFFILGYPGDTIEDVEKTIDFATSLPLHNAHFSQYMPLVGTPAYAELIENGLIDPEALDLGLVRNDKAALSLPGMPAKKLLRLQRLAYLRFYLRPWRLANLLIEMSRSQGLSAVVIRRFAKLFR